MSLIRRLLKKRPAGSYIFDSSTYTLTLAVLLFLCFLCFVYVKPLLYYFGFFTVIAHIHYFYYIKNKIIVTDKELTVRHRNENYSYDFKDITEPTLVFYYFGSRDRYGNRSCSEIIKFFYKTEKLISLNLASLGLSDEHFTIYAAILNLHPYYKIQTYEKEEEPNSERIAVENI